MYDIKNSVDWIVNHIKTEIEAGNLLDSNEVESEIWNRVEIELEEIGKDIFKNSYWDSIEYLPEEKLIDEL